MILTLLAATPYRLKYRLEHDGGDLFHEIPNVTLVADLETAVSGPLLRLLEAPYASVAAARTALQEGAQVSLLTTSIDALAALYARVLVSANRAYIETGADVALAGGNQFIVELVYHHTLVR